MAMSQYAKKGLFIVVSSTKRRPINRLKAQYIPGTGKAQIAESPSQINSILWRAATSEHAKRNAAICLLLFASGLRINELSQFKIRDILYANGELKRSFRLPAAYTKTGKSRIVYIVVKQLRDALDLWLDQRVAESAMLGEHPDKYRALRPDSPVFLSKKGTWRKFAFNTKRYSATDPDGKKSIRETKVCSSLENLVRELFKESGLEGGSSHSGRRTFGSWLDRKGCTLEAIQSIMNHEDPATTLIYIEAWEKRIDLALKSHLSGVKMPKMLQ